MNTIKKKDNESISILTRDLSKARSETKSLQKTIHNLEKKNNNMKDKIENLNASRHEIMEEKKEITIENKKLEKKLKQHEGAHTTLKSNNNYHRSSSNFIFKCIHTNYSNHRH